MRHHEHARAAAKWTVVDFTVLLIIGIITQVVHVDRDDASRSADVARRQVPEITAVVPGRDRPVSLAKVTGNYQRLNRHTFKPVAVKSIRLHITTTNGDELARVYEVRCYA